MGAVVEISFKVIRNSECSFLERVFAQAFDNKKPVQIDVTKNPLENSLIVPLFESPLLVT